MKFQNPPAFTRGHTGKGSRGPYKYVEEAAALRKRPNRWALVIDGASGASFANWIKAGRLMAFQPAGDFESTSRSRPDGKFDIYARYVGGAK